MSPRQTVIEGYASLFGVPDLARDEVARGAFATSLARRPAAMIGMLHQHEAQASVGVWDQVREDGRGLFVRGRIIETDHQARYAAALVRAGALDGLSIGFRTVASHRPDRGGLRILTQIDLWEVSLVSFPMLPQARLRVVARPPSVAAARPAGLAA